MVIDLDVRQVAATFAASESFAALVQAVIDAEGGRDAIVRAVQCSEPSITEFQPAVRVVCRSAIHAMADYIQANTAEPFVTFWANRWAPRHVANDPHDLNANWPTNVDHLWLSGKGHAA